MPKVNPPHTRACIGIEILVLFVLKALPAPAATNDARNLISAKALFGLLYTQGAGVEKNEDEANRWLRLAADAELTKAEYLLGLRYVGGVGDEKNRDAGKALLRKAVAKGSQEAKEQLDRIDYIERMTLGRASPAARAGKADAEAEAQYQKAIDYSVGHGVKRDEVEAAKWYLKAAERGLLPAQKDIAELYRRGQGVPRDDAESVKWLRLAAGQGDAQSRFLLGTALAEGRGVVMDLVEAYQWLAVARASGVIAAEAKLNEICARLTPKEMSQAQDRANAMLPRSTLPSPGVIPAPPPK